MAINGNIKDDINLFGKIDKRHELDVTRYIKIYIFNYMGFFLILITNLTFNF